MIYEKIRIIKESRIYESRIYNIYESRVIIYQSRRIIYEKIRIIYESRRIIYETSDI